MADAGDLAQRLEALFDQCAEQRRVDAGEQHILLALRLIVEQLGLSVPDRQRLAKTYRARSDELWRDLRAKEEVPADGSDEILTRLDEALEAIFLEP